LNPLAAKLLILYSAVLPMAINSGASLSTDKLCGNADSLVLIAEQPNAPPLAGAGVKAEQPFVVFIHSTCCPVCAKVRPIMHELEKSYDGKIQFIYLDVTDEKAKSQSKKIAKSKGLGAFFALYEDTFPCVGVFNGKNKCIKELYGFQTKEKYLSVMDKVIASN